MLRVDELGKFVEKHLDRLEEGLKTLGEAGGVEKVHQCRVASRRLNEPMELLAALGNDKRIRNRSKALGDIRDELRDVRDIDVLLVCLGKSDAAAPIEAPHLAQLEGELTSRRARHLKRACKKLDAMHPQKSIAAVRGLLEKVESGFNEEDLSRQVGKMWRRRVRDLLKCDPAVDGDADLHRARINIKRLRYLTELIDRLRDSRQEALLAVLIAMQDRLGAWNDHLVAAHLLARRATRRSVLAQHADYGAAVLGYTAARVAQADAGRAEIILEWPLLRSSIEHHDAGPVNDAPVSPSEMPVHP